MLELNIADIRALKGAPLSVLVLMSLAGKPVSQNWLARSSGYTDKPVQQACRYLKEQGLAVCSPAGWSLSASLQLCPADDDVGGEARQGGNNSAPALSSIKSSIKDLNKDLEGPNTTNPHRRTFSDPGEKERIWNELYRQGLRHNARTDAMVECEHVTVDYIRALAAKMDAQGKGGAKHSGLFILACEKGERIEQSYYDQVDEMDQILKRGRWAAADDDEYEEEEYDDVDDQSG